MSQQHPQPAAATEAAPAEPAASVVRRRIMIFVIAALVDAVGTGTFMGGSALYFVRTVHLTAGQVGIGVTASAVLGLIATVPWGHAARRFGARPIYLTLLLARGSCFAAYAFIGNFPTYLLVACLLGSVDQPASPIQQEMVALVVSGMDRQRALGWIRSTRNLGYTLGAGVAAIVSTTSVFGGYRTVVMVNAASFFGAAALVATIVVPRVAKKAGAAAPAKLAGILSDRRYLKLTVINGVVATHMVLLGVALPLWILKRTSLPAVTIPVMVAVNTVTVVLCQVYVAGRVKDTMTAARALVAGAVMLAGCCAVAALFPHTHGAVGIAAAVVAALLLTGTEMTQSAAGWRLSFDLAPDEGRPVYLARFNLGPLGQRLVMPLLLTGVVFPLGTVGWLAFGAALAAVGAAAPRVVRGGGGDDQGATAAQTASVGVAVRP
jgi:predicted MFS family arabinose efflux permease